VGKTWAISEILTVNFEVFLGSRKGRRGGDNLEIGKGRMVADFEAAAFALGLNNVYLAFILSAIC
jgi:hypothetical protein